jgi:protocatechuate 3,4-dioxygenase beta subunit
MRTSPADDDRPGGLNPQEIRMAVQTTPEPEVALHELVEETDRGLVYDLSTLMDRRAALKALGFTTVSAGLLSIVACSPGATASPSASRAAAAASAGTGSSAVAGGSDPSCELIPEETAGPFPGDGSNGPNVLNQSGVVREDIRSSFGSSSGTAAGVPLTIRLAIQDAASGCAPMQGAAVYVWHCDRDGNYSLYSQAAASQNYLRGVQATDGGGVATFQSIVPACYPGRWPHIHFEVYPNLEAATDEANRIATSQIALPKDICEAVYATDGYAQSVQNLSRVSLEGDNVFGDDGGVHELGTMSGEVASGLTVTLAVNVQG